MESTARDAYERCYELVMVSDAMTGLSAESHADAVERISPRIGRVPSTEQLIAAFAELQDFENKRQKRATLH